MISVRTPTSLTKNSGIFAEGRDHTLAPVWSVAIPSRMGNYRTVEECLLAERFAHGEGPTPIDRRLALA